MDIADKNKKDMKTIHEESKHLTETATEMLVNKFLSALTAKGEHFCLHEKDWGKVIQMLETIEKVQSIMQRGTEEHKKAVQDALDTFLENAKAEDKIRRDDLNEHLKKLYTRAEENALAGHITKERLKNLILLIVFAIPILCSAFGWWVMEHKISMIDAIKVAHDAWITK